MFNNMKNFIGSFFLLAAIVACRSSMPNPVLGTWQPDSNLYAKVVFKDSMYIHRCCGVESYPFTFENNWLEVGDSAKKYYAVYFFDDKMRISTGGTYEIFKRVK